MWHNLPVVKQYKKFSYWTNIQLMVNLLKFPFHPKTVWMYAYNCYINSTDQTENSYKLYDTDESN